MGLCAFGRGGLGGAGRVRVSRPRAHACVGQVRASGRCVRWAGACARQVRAQECCAHPARASEPRRVVGVTWASFLP